MCDIGYIVKDHIPALMQLITHDLPQYNMKLVTTKCLNTAVMFMYLFLGDKAYRYTGHCDVQNVQLRYKESGDASLSLLNAFRKELLSPDATERELYYVMLTDGYVPIVDNVNNESTPVANVNVVPNKVYFPGHVFVIEKIPPSAKCNLDVVEGNAKVTTASNSNSNSARNSNSNRKPKSSTKQTPRYNIYQSYIDEYDFAGHVVKNKSLSCSYNRMSTTIVDGLQHIFSTPTWNAKDNEFWKEFTYVDGSQWNGGVFKGNILFCYTRVTTTTCVAQLRVFLQKKLNELQQKLTDEETQPEATYGVWHCDANQTPTQCYNTGPKSIRPLTNQQMQEEIEEMLFKI